MPSAWSLIETAGTICLLHSYGLESGVLQAVADSRAQIECSDQYRTSCDGWIRAVVHKIMRIVILTSSDLDLLPEARTFFPFVRDERKCKS